MRFRYKPIIWQGKIVVLAIKKSQSQVSAQSWFHRWFNHTLWPSNCQMIHFGATPKFINWRFFPNSGYKTNHLNCTRDTISAFAIFSQRKKKANYYVSGVLAYPIQTQMLNRGFTCIFLQCACIFVIYHSEFREDEWSDVWWWLTKSKLIPSFFALVNDKFSSFFHRSSLSRSRFRSLKTKVRL